MTPADAEPEVLPKPVVEMSTRQGRLQAVLQATEPGVKAAASPLCLLVSLSDALGEFFHVRWVHVQGGLGCLFLWNRRRVLVKEEVRREPLLMPHHLPDFEYLVSRPAALVQP